jgi:adenosylcobinamide kinase / adenosylcobinamide-phosphate guanylyltransferase
MHELILGGQKSGKSRRAESLAVEWLATHPGHQAVFIATAQAWPGDDGGEMHQRITRHQRDRAQRLPGMRTVEEPLHLADTLAEHSHPDTLIVIDCLTLWLTNFLMPMKPLALDLPTQKAMLLEAIKRAPGPVVIVSNEIGLGVIPLGRDVRAYVDALGGLNQDVARVCTHVTLMAAGLPLTLKAPA